MNRAPRPQLLVTALLLTQFCFGLNYIVSKVVVETLPPFLWAGLRCAVSCVLLASFALALKRRHPRGRDFFVKAFWFSFLAISFNQGCFLLGLHYTSSTNSAILNTLIPVFTLIVVVFRRQETVTGQKLLSFALALAGVLVLVRADRFELGHGMGWGDFLTLLNSFSYALYLGTSKDFLCRYDRVWITVWLFAFGTVTLNIAAIPDWLHFQWPPISAALWACMIFVVVVGTFVTYLLTNWVLAYVEASKVALYVYIQPVVAAWIAWCWRGEVITFRTLLGSCLIFFGVFFVGKRAVAGAAPPLPAS